jgi:hypothetical protein
MLGSMGRRNIFSDFLRDSYVLRDEMHLRFVGPMGFEPMSLRVSSALKKTKSFEGL